MASPFERTTMDAYPSKTGWDADAPELLASMLERWHLSEVQMFPATAAAIVASVRRADGTSAVLKIGYPHPEAIWEAVTLDALPRDLAPQVLEQDVWTWAMLLERLDPGTLLSGAGLPALDAAGIGGELHRRIRTTPPPSGVETLAEQYRPFVDRLAEATAVSLLRDAGAPDGEVLDAIEEFDRLCATAPEAALLHGDLNPTNVLRHGTSWRVIDPKPATGDPAFDTFSIVRDLLPDTGSAEGLAQLTAPATGAAGIDADRALRWVRVRVRGILSAFWNLEDGLIADGRRDLQLARFARELLGR